jgi:hypothetical protein
LVLDEGAKTNHGRSGAIPNTPVYNPMMIATAIPITINIFRFAIIF